MRLIPLILIIGLLSSCHSAKFYQQAILGQGSLLMQRESTAALLAADDLDPELRYRIELANEILGYAASRGLSGNGSYTDYVETGEPFVVWNVFAARPLSLALEQSCFPIAGCVSYRGYFKRADAERYASYLRKQGLETYIGGVAAYSTLGWFDDPLLDTFLFRSEEGLAALLFHELAHQRLYVRDDTRFNESLATTIEHFLLEKWLAQRGESARYAAYASQIGQRQAVIRLIDEARAKLQHLYAGEKTDADKLREKEALIAELVGRYERLAADWGEDGPFRSWMHAPINNAKLETVADYNQWVGVLTAHLTSVGLGQFFQDVELLAGLSITERTDRLLTGQLGPVSE